jgi:TorA maturation chaperone TorD/NAD-dependent dihydropyrimidine dehydrogenase PreA subunit
MESEFSSSRAALYQSLAEALAPVGPPEWMAEEGKNWPLYQAAAALTPISRSARRAVKEVETIPARPTERLRESYSSLFTSSLRPYSDLYESAWLRGLPMGPETVQVERVYRAAGLEIDGAELADHAALELAFLAYLAGKSEQDLERSFIRMHPGRWLPALGHRLSLSGDTVYAPVGSLLAGWLEEAALPVNRPSQRKNKTGLRPSIQMVDACTLCSFCVQVCPTHSLWIEESSAETVLWLSPGTCRSCGRCEEICQFGALRLEPFPVSVSAPDRTASIILCSSPRVVCAICGIRMVSQAELDFIRHVLANPRWLDCCQNCRPNFLCEEKNL